MKEVLEKEDALSSSDKPLRMTFEAILFFLILLLDVHLRLRVKPIYHGARSLSLSAVTDIKDGIP